MWNGNLSFVLSSYSSIVYANIHENMIINCHIFAYYLKLKDILYWGYGNGDRHHKQCSGLKGHFPCYLLTHMDGSLFLLNDAGDHHGFYENVAWAILQNDLIWTLCMRCMWSRYTGKTLVYHLYFVKHISYFFFKFSNNRN